LDATVVSVTDVSPTTTVLEYLRELALRPGTKEGCAEGDCGACMVVLGELSACGTRIDYRAINSCLRLLPTIDGCELITVESLQDAAGHLHPVQQAMVACHASQCGFCTPGFVMSLFALYLQTDAAPEHEQVVTALAGNLCRCTGYRPIITAGRQMHEYPPPQRWSRSDAQSAERIRRLQALRADTLRLPGFIAPNTTDELAAALLAQPDARLLAGGTDLGLLVTKQLLELPSLIYLGRIAELARIEGNERRLRVGAGVSLTAAWAALLAWYPTLAEVAQRFASPPICNSGTLCGNIANGSPIGDSMPILLALDAQLELRCGAQTRRLALDDFYLGYRRTALARGEFIVAVEVPRPSAQLRCTSYKLAKRWDQDISAVCAGIAVHVECGVIYEARLAFGGMAPTPARARHAEAQLRGQPWSAACWKAAQAALAQDFTPLSDQRASSEYRLQAAANLLERFFLEHSTPAPRTRLSAVGGE
jgi:xanthine dehydrogenase small subunit